MTELTIYEYSPRIKHFEVRATLQGNADFEVEPNQTVFKISRVNLGEHVYISIYLVSVEIRPVDFEKMRSAHQ